MERYTKESHFENIKCPDCGTVQEAIVLHTNPWWTYEHECTECRYIIMESDWHMEKEDLDI